MVVVILFPVISFSSTSSLQRSSGTRFNRSVRFPVPPPGIVVKNRVRMWRQAGGGGRSEAATSLGSKAIVL